MGISKQPRPIQFMVDQKQLVNVEYFDRLGSMKMIPDVHIKLNTVLPQQKQHSTPRILSSTENWTSI
jgi:serine kinase of HPr protein (carbohydrate metabolism regulator)